MASRSSLPVSSSICANVSFTLSFPRSTGVSRPSTKVSIRRGGAAASVTRLMVTSIFGTASLTLFAFNSARKPSVDPDENGLKSSRALVMYRAQCFAD
eukprot:CAMPEP_0185473070 /NCGR_PEP_ID=MMETSP1366-20130426/1220_1 /TAXON_ID=38817 /ORGANISM="Gephyrocapsa oceanica, Strain RCC1303" /LENGTH=97 /DNA_ID=CAMNT_0028079907 /DNA_START=155 /DNA_END=445 /DNA_ORIENTATION=-